MAKYWTGGNGRVVFSCGLVTFYYGGSFVYVTPPPVHPPPTPTLIPDLTPPTGPLFTLPRETRFQPSGLNKDAWLLKM